ncbi:MAG: hypothetical protein ACK40G_17330 [Cytophagaceae bacterium]
MSKTSITLNVLSINGAEITPENRIFLLSAIKGQIIPSGLNSTFRYLDEDVKRVDTIVVEQSISAIDALLSSAEASPVEKTVRVVYDFALHGGAVGDIALDPSVVIPDNAIITEVIQDIVTAPDSGTDDDGTIKLKLAVDGDLTEDVTADAGTDGIVAGIPDGTVENMIKTTAARVPQVEIGTNDLTEGKIVYFIKYIQSV